MKGHLRNSSRSFGRFSTLRYGSIIILVVILLSGSLQGQNIDDAVRMNTREVIGTARNLALGGAMGSVGGDMSAVASNPASLTVYRTSEWSFSPGFVLQNANSSFAQLTDFTSSEDRRSNVVIPSAGYVQTKSVLSRSVVQTNFGIGVNRIADFNQKFSYDGQLDGSITQFFRDRAGTLSRDQLDAFAARPAFDAFVISRDSAFGDYLADIDGFTPVRKRETIDRWGGIDEVFLAYAARFRSNISFGMSMSLPIIKYDEVQEYTETISGNPEFQELNYNEDLRIRGTGFNLKIGGKAEINRWLHVGAAIHTPTWWRITDEYTTTVDYTRSFDPQFFPVNGTATGRSPNFPLEYGYRAPWRFLGTLAARMKRLGFVFGEVEYEAGRVGRFNVDGDEIFEAELNADVDAILIRTLAIRLGAEFRVKKDWRLRVGSSIGESSLNFANEGLELNSFSAGVGRWWGRYFIDLGYRRMTSDFNYQPYEVRQGTPTVVANEFTQHFFVLTGGVRID